MYTTPAVRKRKTFQVGNSTDVENSGGEGSGNMGLHLPLGRMKKVGKKSERKRETLETGMICSFHIF